MRQYTWSKMDARSFVLIDMSFVASLIFDGSDSGQEDGSLRVDRVGAMYASSSNNRETALSKAKSKMA